MRPNPPGFTLREVMVLVALVALNLAAGVAVSRSLPRPGVLTVGPIGVGDGRSRTSSYPGEFYESSVAETVRYDANTRRFRPTSIRRVPPRPTLLRVWCPVLLSASATLLAVAFGGPARGRPWFRAACVAAALVSLNLAGGAYALELDIRRWLSRPVYFTGPGTYTTYLDAQGIEEGLDTGGRKPRNLRHPYRPTLAEVALPLLATASVSALVLAFPSLQRRFRRSLEPAGPAPP